MNFYTTLAQLLQTSDTRVKNDLLEQLYQNFTSNRLDFQASSDPLVWTQPSYSGRCDVIDPKIVPKRNRLSTLEGRRILLHAIAHIEYSAIDLALDACYRFRGVPEMYYRDWLEVARDEMRHFLLLEELLIEHGSFYGAYPVHNALFEAGVKTTTLLERMAVVPRFMEANGLDANPKLIKKLEPFKSEARVAKIIEVLELILREEIDHVSKGDRWFDYACKEAGVDKMRYFEIINSLYPNTFPRKHSVNIEARKAAGFSCEELAKIAEKGC